MKNHILIGGRPMARQEPRPTAIRLKRGIAILNGIRFGRSAGFQACTGCDRPRCADLEIGGTAGLETCATRQKLLVEDPP
jgi:hypothetical protein